jgi:hypothetical protein
MDDVPPTAGTGRRPSLAWVGLLLTGLLSVVPLLVEPRPVTFLPPPATAALAWGGKALVVLLMVAAVAVRAWADRRTEARPGLLALGFVCLAGLLTACHWYEVDRVPLPAAWQRDLYLKVLNHEGDPDNPFGAPHNFRPLPYGFTRALERVTGDWWFACVAYRWFFTYWFVWAWYRFARLFLAPPAALLSLLPLPLLYPLSVFYYWGQLTDPLSHFLFVLALVYIVEDRPAPLGAALALGVLAKETAVILVPAYWACWWRKGVPALLRTGVLGAVCVAAYVAVRAPLGWRPGYGAINGTEGLMIGTNLGIGPPLYRGAPGDETVFPNSIHVSQTVFQNYLHPLLFVGVFLPAVVWNWRRLDGRLRALFLTVTPLLLLSNLCFGWMYESRNYVPLLPLLATMALDRGRRPGE